MNFLFILLTLLLVFNTLLTAQERLWREEYSGTNDDLTGVACFNDGTSLVVSNRGNIFRKTATTWWKPIHNTDGALSKVRSLPNSNIAVAVGEFGAILRSTNKGATWSQYPNVHQGTNRGEETSYYDVAVLNNYTYIAVGAYRDTAIITVTSDYGWSWQDTFHAVPNAMVDMIDIAVADDSVVYVLGNEYFRQGMRDPRVFIKRSTNSGKDWQTIYLPQDFNCIGTAITAGANRTVALFGLSTIQSKPLYLFSTTNGTLWSDRSTQVTGLVRTAEFTSPTTNEFIAGAFTNMPDFQVQAQMMRNTDSGLRIMDFDANQAPNDVIMDISCNTSDWYVVGTHGTILKNTLDIPSPRLTRDLDSIIYVNEGEAFELKPEYSLVPIKTEWRHQGILLEFDTLPTLSRTNAKLYDDGYYQVRFVGAMNRVTRSRLCRVVVIQHTSSVDEMDNRIVISPQPAHSTLQVRGIEESLKLTLRSLIDGSVMLNSSANYLSTENIPSGAYMLEITPANGRQIRRPIMVLH
jgi:photosystem II stability/assembly factor-like uncharacterized protein